MSCSRTFKRELREEELVSWKKQLRQGAYWVGIVEKIEACADPDDNKFLEASWGLYIVTQGIC